MKIKLWRKPEADKHFIRWVTGIRIEFARTSRSASW
jgi:hypothetical protein